MRQTAWAVFLGCSTAHRLAYELGISHRDAVNRLYRAARAGMIRQIGAGVYAATFRENCA